MKIKDPTQNEMILRDLKAGKRITQLTALQDYGCLRLSARISELKTEMGEAIYTNNKKVGDKKVAEYYMLND